jgi:hypothetical protein
MRHSDYSVLICDLSALEASSSEWSRMINHREIESIASNVLQLIEFNKKP